jgi:hypothetical protein
MITTSQHVYTSDGSEHASRVAEVFSIEEQQNEESNFRLVSASQPAILEDRKRTS